MTTKSSGLFLISRSFLKNILILLVALVLGFFLITWFMNFYTHHGQNIAVPNLVGLKITNLKNALEPHNFNYKIVDSLYDVNKAPGTVLDQDPARDSKVKEGRTIYLTISMTLPPDVRMPDLIDVSSRQAEAMLQSFGLVIGEISYRSDMAKNAVLEQRYKNSIIKPGTMIPKGSEIDLVLGDGLGDLDVNVPDVKGLSRNEAWSVLKRASLNIGLVLYDDDTDDTLNAKIYKQSPDPSEGSAKPGDSVDLYLR